MSVTSDSLLNALSLVAGALEDMNDSSSGDSDSCSQSSQDSEHVQMLESNGGKISACVHGVQMQRRSPRKPAMPQKSASPADPKFKGVTLHLRTKLQRNRSQLNITAYYNCSKRLSRIIRRHRSDDNIFPNEYTSECEEPEPQITKPRRPGATYTNLAGKQCASCGTKKTPLWRDAEDGTPLCNACGIRYKKYRVRCSHCWHIPKKDSKAQPTCAHCGEILRFPFPRKPV